MDQTRATDVRTQAAAELEIRRRHAARARALIDDLPGFATEVLGLTPWDRATEMLTAIQEHDRVVIRAGRKVTKSTALVAAAAWWAYRGGKVLMTSSSYPQIVGTLWTELRKLIRASGFRVTVPLSPETGVRFPSGGTIVGRSVAQRENLQGYSGHDALYVVDEASGVDRFVLEAIEGNVAGGGKIVMAGNPTRVVGPFYDAFHSQARAWHQIQISSRESPNVTGGRSIPGLATPEWIALTEETHGAESEFVAVHVNGDFPTNASNAVIPLALVTAAQARWAEAPDTGPLSFGVDVGRTGSDPTVVYPVRGRKALEPRHAHGLDSYGVAAFVLQVARNVMTAAERAAATTGGTRPRCNVDVIGIGAGAYDVLANTAGALLEVTPVNVAEAATSEGHRLLRDQIWYGVADWLKDGGALPPHDPTREELIAPTFTFDPRGRYRVASKDDLRETLGRSPDYADALGLGVHRPALAAGPIVWSA